MDPLSSPNDSADSLATKGAEPSITGDRIPDTAEFRAPSQSSDYTDGRLPGDWQTRYPPQAKRCINQEAAALCIYFLFFTISSGIFLGMSSQTMDIALPFLDRMAAKTIQNSNLSFHISFQFIATFFIGGLGGTTFSIKWLVHAAAKRKWNLDRRYWRLFVPLIGGVYACVVLALFDAGIIGGHSGSQPRPIALSAAFSFLVGYFSDGVSGLLSNIANAVFGTLEKK